MFFDINGYLGEKIWRGLGVPPPLGDQNGAPKNLFLKRLKLRCQCFLISVDILETNILKWFEGTTPLGNQKDPPKINFFNNLI